MILLHTAVITCVLMFICWLFYLKSRNPGIVDVFWSVGILLNAIVYYWTSQSSVLFLLPIIAWATRLSIFLFITRVYTGEKDKRYLDMSQKWKNEVRGFLYNYLFQGFLIWLLSLSFYAMRFVGDSYNSYTVIALILCFLAIIAEAIADWQLYQFKQSSTQGVCDTGLWYYSRHPNYFFEWLTWLFYGVALFSISTHLLSFVAPVVIFIITYFITGPITEEHSLKSRGEAFSQYQKKTSYYFPLPKRPL